MQMQVLCAKLLDSSRGQIICTQRVGYVRRIGDHDDYDMRIRSLGSSRCRTVHQNTADNYEVYKMLSL